MPKSNQIDSTRRVSRSLMTGQASLFGSLLSTNEAASGKKKEVRPIAPKIALLELDLIGPIPADPGEVRTRSIGKNWSRRRIRTGDLLIANHLRDGLDVVAMREEIYGPDSRGSVAFPAQCCEVARERRRLARDIENLSRSERGEVIL